MIVVVRFLRRRLKQLVEKPNFLSFRGALRAEESLFSCI
jgi:hypothetical protein